MRIKHNLILHALVDLLVVNTALGMVLALSRGGFGEAYALGEVYIEASVIAICTFYIHGIYHRLWRFAGVRDYLVLMQSVLLYTVLLFFGSKLIPPSFQPLETIVLACISGFQWTLQ